MYVTSFAFRAGDRLGQGSASCGSDKDPTTECGHCSPSLSGRWWSGYLEPFGEVRVRGGGSDESSSHAFSGVTVRMRRLRSGQSLSLVQVLALRCSLEHVHTCELEGQPGPVHVETSLGQC